MLKINESYLLEKDIQEVSTVFFANSPIKSILLQNFFEKNSFNLLQKKIAKTKFKKLFQPLDFSFSFLKAPKELVEVLELFVEVVLGRKFKAKNSKVLEFEHGDYSLLSDEPSKHKLLAFFHLTDWPENFGGFISIVQENKEVLRLKHKENSFSLIALPAGTKYFVKYINVLAGKKKLKFAEIEF